MGGAAKAVEKVVTGIGKAAESLIKNPLPVIETVALSAVGVPLPVAAAAVSAANGGNINQIATAAAAVYVGGEVAGSAGASATEAGASATTAKIASSAAGASAGTVTAALASGQPLDKALEAGLKSGALAAGTTGVIEAEKSALSGPPTGAAMKAATSTVPAEQAPGDYSVKADYSLPSQTTVSGLGLTDKVPTGGGQGLTVDPSTVLFSSQFAPSTGKVRGTEEGGLQPAYKSAADTLTPAGFDKTIAPDVGYKEPSTVKATSEPVISKTTESLAEATRPLVSGALSELFGLGPKIPGTAGTTTITQGATTGTTVGLTGERGAGEIESKETGKPRQNVWNEASLRLKDALGV